MDLAKQLRQMSDGWRVLGVSRGQKYASFEEYVLTKGKPYASQPLTESELALVRQLTSGHRFPIKQCFHNSQMLVWHQYRMRMCPLQYVEGYACSDIGFPVLHAWLTINGKVVDLTLRTKKTTSARGFLRDRVVGEFDPPRAYYGVEFDNVRVVDRIVKNKRTCSIIDDFYERWPELA